MRIYEWKLLAECQHPEKSIGAVMVETKCFQFIKWPHMTACLKGYVNLWVEALQGKSPQCLVAIRMEV